MKPNLLIVSTKARILTLSCKWVLHAPKQLIHPQMIGSLLYVIDYSVQFVRPCSVVGGQRVRGVVQLESPIQLCGSVDEYTPGSRFIALAPTLCQELPYCVCVHVRSVGAQAVEQVCATHIILSF